MAAAESRDVNSSSKWSQGRFWQVLQTEWQKVPNPQEFMSQTIDLVTREQPKEMLKEFERLSARFSATCGAPDPAAAAADELVFAARSMKARRFSYVVDNSKLQSESKVLSYSFTKSLWDKVPAEYGAPWGCTVQGVEDGDGWLRVGHRYLPMELDGMPVLRRIDEDAEEDEDDVSTSECSSTQESQTTAAASEPLPDLIDVGLPDLIDLAGSTSRETDVHLRSPATRA